MKINIDVDDSLQQDMITIHCREITDEILELQRLLSQKQTGGQKISAYIDDTEYYVDVKTILFLEADGNYISVHTAKSIYRVRQKLYELEELLPRDFLRVSKSTIVNTELIASIKKNITGASEISFRNSTKKTYASRNYIKALIEIMDEKRLKR
ncbi:MAG: LytTR family transcriptional regulator [Pseudobutyrivibrio sp.]|jgi:DNA-binding LytR/AlgR family response regulator|uniref:LytTR family DNA-binding domain-containing protein n=1 Tax=Pseudobutyrivibrio sp. TaxID=2014367 RepID=UPI0025E2ADC9|nr:LytTR family DNA-binding domain-containing protein [Pseudobutyrivibrio sp.]MBE5903646.1 LytTR family transcriptional regulator [Pseudobutyrivibrio sp.]